MIRPLYMTSRKLLFGKNACVLFLFMFLPFLLICTQAQMRQVYTDPDENNHIEKISFYSPSEGYVAFTKWIGFSSDSGRTFIKKYITLGNVDYNGYSVNLTFGFGIKGVKAFNKDNLIVYGDYGFVPAILYSIDQGNSFRLVYQSQFNLSRLSGITDLIFPGNSNIGYAVEADRIIKTVDKGKSWFVARSAPNSYLDFLEAVDNTTLFAFNTTYTDRALLKTTDAGVTWQSITLPADGRISYAFFIDINKGWLNITDNSGSIANLYYTSDGGQSWVQKNNTAAMPVQFGKMKFTNDSVGYALAGFYNVYKTTDSGRVWEPLPRQNNYSYFYYSHQDLYCINLVQLWAGGGHGFLELSNNAGGTPLPKAYFDIDTSHIKLNNMVDLVNYSKPTYQYEWFVNSVLVSTSYHASYTHDSYHPQDTIKLVVKNGARSDTVEKYRYIGAIPGPLIASFSPTSGTVGDVITINGSNLLTASAIHFGNTPAASFNVVSSNKIIAVVGEGTSGSIHVTTTGGETSSAGFDFIPPPPIITSFSPARTTAGSVITITGNFFDGATDVQFGGTPAVSFKVISNTQVQAIVGTGSDGNISVTTGRGTGTAAGFTIIPKITITSFSPVSGPIGTTVIIRGTNFSEAVAGNIVFFGGAKAKIISASSTTLTVVVPPGATYVPVTVTTSSQTVAADRPFVVTFPGGGTINTNSFQEAGTYKVRQTSFDINYGCMGDIDMDGKLDMVTGNTNQHASMSVFRNTSVGNNINFGQRIDLITNHTPLTNLLRDMNMDGLPDLVIGSGDIMIAKNMSTPGNIAFDNLIPFSFWGSNHGLAIDDIDGDGRPDVAASLMFGDKVGIIRNSSRDGIISFEPPIELPAGDDPWGTALADLDGDRKPELIVPNYYDLNVSVYRNTSTPGLISFESPIKFATSGSRGLATGDLDGDGKIDLAIAGSAGLSILRNTSTGNGSISFAPLVKYPGIDNFSAQIADLNGDGRPDIITPNQGNQSVSVYENKSSSGSISFSPKVNFASVAFGYPRSAPIGDLDNDGKPDFNCVNYGQQSFTVFRNRINESFANAGIDTAICAGDSTQLGTHAMTGNSYTWTSFPAGFSSTEANPVVRPAVATTYYLEVTNNTITYKDTVAVHVTPTTVADAGPDHYICKGAYVKIGSALSTGNSFTWTSNPTGFNSSSIDPVVAPVTTTSFYLSAVNAAGCVTRDTVWVNVSDAQPPAVTIATANSEICSGEPTSFTATPTNGGSAPGYQWQVNGINTGTNNNTFITSALTNGSTVKVIMTSNDTCVAARTTSSNIITMSVRPKMSPLVSISGTTAVTANQVTVVTATAIQAGTDPAYQWQDSTNTHNWQNVVNGDAPVINYFPAKTGDKIRCILTSHYSCASNPVVTSNALTFVVNVITAVDPVPAASQGIVYYPNPVTSQLIIDSLKLSDRWETLQITSLNGAQKLIQENISNKTRVMIKVDKLESGVYVAILRRKSGVPVYLKFVRL